MIFVLNCITSFPPSSFSIILTRKRDLVALSCYCKCSVALPYGAMGWSAVCDCGIS